MTSQFVAIAIGGGVGSVARHALSTWVAHLFGTPPHLAGTLAVNLIGCSAIGFLFRLSESIPNFDADWRPLLMSGFLGGFTTFSAFGLELFQQTKLQNPGTALLYATASVAGGLAMTWVGYQLAAGVGAAK